ncbi:MAG: hypothetical protein J5778_05590 [Clostridiales bacterium]|nr:hypothetical protein [Clostridiales bacterium]
MAKKRILCFGDSNTWGYDPATGMRFEGRWPRVLAELAGPNYEIVEEGQNGRTIALEDPWEWGTKRGLDYCLPMIESHKPLDIIVIMLGSNDLKRKFSLPAPDIAGSLMTMIEKMTAHLKFYNQTPDTKILIVAPPPLGDNVLSTDFAPFFNEYSVEQSKLLAQWYSYVADRCGTEFLDAGQFVKASDIDSLHMTEDGHKALAKAVWDKIETL